jgi:acyl carrier protein
VSDDATVQVQATPQVQGADNLGDQVINLIADHLQMDPKNMQASLDVRPLGDDDQAWVLVSAVEDALDVRFPDDFLDGVLTYADFTEAVRRAVGA